MSNDEKAKRRFTQSKEEVNVVFVPQCCKCKLNIDKTTCKHFGEGKPTEYVTNVKECSYIESR